MQKCFSESHLIITIFKVPSKQLRTTLATAFWKTPYSWRFYGHGTLGTRHGTPNSFFKSWLKITQQKSTKVPWKSLFTQRTSHQNNIWIIAIHFFFSPTNQVFKSNPVFIEILISFSTVYLDFCLLIIHILWISTLIQCRCAFL